MSSPAPPEIYLNPLLSLTKVSASSVPIRFLEPPLSPPISSGTSSTFSTKGVAGAVRGSLAPSCGSLTSILTVLVTEFEPSDFVSSNSYMLSPFASEGLS